VREPVNLLPCAPATGSGRGGAVPAG
jgi:hypothetical protein